MLPLIESFSLSVYVAVPFYFYSMEIFFCLNASSYLEELGVNLSLDVRRLLQMPIDLH